MRVLIAGAGIAGLTLSALLRQKGIKPQIVDRASDFAQAGYMLGLFPMGNRVLHGLGAFEAFVRRSEPMDTYAMCNGHGETMPAVARRPARDPPRLRARRAAQHGHPGDRARRAG